MIPVVGLLEAGLKILDRVLPDPAAKAAAQLELIKQQQAGEFKQLEADLQMAQGQVEINKIEAGSGSLFKSGWRPGVGWVCVAGLAWEWIGVNVASFVMVVEGQGALVAQLPHMSITEMLTLLVPMLGLGVYRTAEKIKGVA